MAQRMGKGLLEQAGHVDLVMGPEGYRELPAALERIRTGDAPEARPERRRRTQLAVLELDPRENYEGLEQRHTSSIAAWIPIQQG